MLLLALSMSLALSACMPAFLQQTANPTPTVDIAATSAAFEATMIAQTFAALPSPTLFASSTPEVLPATDTPTGFPTSTEILAASGTAAPSSPGSATSTPVVFTGSATETPTLGVMYFGTIPPLVPSGRIILVNRSHAQAYVSFQCINKEGTLSILEYPVGRWMEEKIPSGKCKYVAWVGGREFIGEFSLATGGQKLMTFYLDRVRIK
jgi:hypothetical protein